jgi:hypothetical protein
MEIISEIMAEQQEVVVVETKEEVTNSSRLS